jgi:subtilisin family serine protease
MDGTSFSAPFIAGTAALLRSQFRGVPIEMITKSLLCMASPVVMNPNPSRGRETPVVIRSARAVELKPSDAEIPAYIYYSPKGKREISVTQTMIDRGRQKYGVGIINISGAIKFLKLYEIEPALVERHCNNT